MKRLMLSVVVAASLAMPAAADNIADSTDVPVGLDILTRVVFGIPLTVVGAAAMIPAGLATAVTRPSDMHKTFDMLVMGPVRYTWVDPLGEHPDPAVWGRVHENTPASDTLPSASASAKPIVGQ